MAERMESAAGAHAAAHLTSFAGQTETMKDRSIGRIVSVTGSKAIVLLDSMYDGKRLNISDRPEMGTLLAIAQQNTVVLAIVSALSLSLIHISEPTRRH